MSQLGDALRAEAAAASDPMAVRLEHLADVADEFVANVVQARQPGARLRTVRLELAAHARMRHPQGKAFHGSCLCGWVGPNTAYLNHVAEAVVDRLTVEGL